MPKTIRQGDKGSEVIDLQNLMDGLKTDGIFGPKTKAAVIMYQSAANLVPDGIVGHKTWASLLANTVTTPTGANSEPGNPFGQPKDYKQGGSPWGPKMYSSRNDPKQTYANSACGPTAAANIVYSAKDKTVTPETLGKLSVANGYRTANNGTAWSFFPFIAKRFGFKKYLEVKNRATLQAALADGALAVCSMAPGYWTKGGHFITVWKDDGTEIWANDPASSARKKQNGAQFMKECKQIFIFWP